MGAFQYTALDASGKERRGVLEGDTAKHVRGLLRDQQLLPVTVTELAEEETRRSKSSFSIGGGVSATDLALLTRQLATLTRAGLPLEEALLAVSQQSEKPRVQRILLGVRAKVMEGHPLATGLGDFPRVFPEIYRATVSAGEQAGHLGRCAGAHGRIHREPRGAATEGAGRPAVPHCAHDHVFCHRVRAAGVRGAEGGRCLRQLQGIAAAGHPRADCAQRFHAHLGHLGADRRGAAGMAGGASPEGPGPRAAASAGCSCGRRWSAASCGASTRRALPAP